MYGRLNGNDTLAVTAHLRNEAGATVRNDLPVSVETGARIPAERVAVVQLPLSGLQSGDYTLVVNAGNARSRRPAATRQLVLSVVSP